MAPTTVRQPDEERSGGEIALERVDRLTEWLDLSLGSRLAAFASGVTLRELGEIAYGAQLPGDETERRLRNLFAVTSLLAARDGPGSAYQWLTEPNPRLGDRTPASLLRQGEAPEAVWFEVATAF